jgi:hypothetical protein
MIEQDFLIYFLYLPISLGVGIFLTGIVLLWIDSRRQKKIVEVKTHNWRETGGKVLETSLDECPKEEIDPEESEKHFQPLIKYVYAVDGVEYRSDNVYPGDCKNITEEQGKEFLEKYPLNSYIPVIYDPDDPNSSALEQQPRQSNRMRMFGLLFTWFGVSVCCFSSLMLFIMSVNFL